MTYTEILGWARKCIEQDKARMIDIYSKTATSKRPGASEVLKYLQSKIDELANKVTELTWVDHGNGAVEDA